MANKTIAVVLVALIESINNIGNYQMLSSKQLKAIGFFTSKMGIQDLGYKGNSPGKWEGVLKDVMEKYGLTNV